MSQLLPIHISEQLYHKVAPTFGKLVVGPAIGDQFVQDGSSTKKIKVAKVFVNFKELFVSKANQD